MSGPQDTRVTERPWLPGSLGQGRDWVLGACWLYCRRQSLPVMWLGPVESSGMQAPMYGCADCVTELDHMVRHSLLAKDSPRNRPPPASEPPPFPPG